MNVLESDLLFACCVVRHLQDSWHCQADTVGTAAYSRSLIARLHPVPRTPDCVFQTHLQANIILCRHRLLPLAFVWLTLR